MLLDLKQTVVVNGPGGTTSNQPIIHRQHGNVHAEERLSNRERMILSHEPCTNCAKLLTNYIVAGFLPVNAKEFRRNVIEFVSTGDVVDTCRGKAMCKEPLLIQLDPKEASNISTSVSDRVREIAVGEIQLMVTGEDPLGLYDGDDELLASYKGALKFGCGKPKNVMSKNWYILDPAPVRCLTSIQARLYGERFYITAVSRSLDVKRALLTDFMIIKSLADTVAKYNGLQPPYINWLVTNAQYYLDDSKVARRGSN